MQTRMLRACLVLSGISLTGCFKWDFLKGQPCTNSNECEPLACNEGVCDGAAGDDGNESDVTDCETIAPRVLFFLNTSGSMALDLTHVPGADPPTTRCAWDNCENDDAGLLQSRINAARNAIRDVAHTHAGEVDFALMTYASARPPTETINVPVPEPCEALETSGSLVEGELYRFAWVTLVNQPQPSQWAPANNVFGTQGIWVLCGDNRPFPYLRHDDLGGFSMPDDSQEPLPDMPLVLAEADEAAYMDFANYSRKVQWFPRFMGRRVNLDCTDPLQSVIAENTAGDYGGGNEKLANVCGRDFYYWPYVDGNPGYSHYHGLSEDAMTHTECDTNGNNCETATDQQHRLGIARREPGSAATLYAPFFSAAALASDDVPDAHKGPQSPEDAWLMFDGITSKSHAGGADVGSNSPMATPIGDPEFHENLWTNAPNWSNAPFGHNTVSSYVKFLLEIEPDPACRPLTIILILDDTPDPWASEGGPKLYERLRWFRELWGVAIYVVPFTPSAYSDPAAATRMHEIACAASGAESETPCVGQNAFGFDTCANPNDPSNGCAWLAADPQQLESNLAAIMAKIIATQ